MTTRVIQVGSTVRVVVTDETIARGIADATVNDAGYLIITYTDGTTQNAGLVRSGSPPAFIASMKFNDARNSMYLGAL